MAITTVTTDGTVVLGDNDIVKVEIPGGGEVTVEAVSNDNVDKITIDFLDDSHSDVVTVDLSTFSEDGLRIDIKKYDETDQIILDGASNIRVNPGRDDEILFDYTGSDGETYTGAVRAMDGGEKDFTADPSPIVICFGKGTMIETDKGLQLIENLRVGDRVLTQSDGYQPILWIGRRALDSVDLARNPHLRPIRVAAGAFGRAGPDVTLTLSPQHRVQIAGWEAELYFGADSVMVPICHLIDGVEVAVEQDCTEVVYYHLMLDKHHVLQANGLAAESLFLGKMSLKAIDAPGQAEIVQLFPEIRKPGRGMRPADCKVRKSEAILLRAFAG